jgi:uncharacterized integral membrane protein
MRTIKLYFYGLLVLVFAVFILQNYSTLTYSVALRLNLGFVSFVSVPLPLFLVAPLFFFCGLFLATIIGAGERRRLAREIKHLKSIRPEPQMEGSQDLIMDSQPEFKPESQIQPEHQPEAKKESGSQKKPDEGTLVSSGPLIPKTGSPEDSKTPFRP